MLWKRKKRMLKPALSAFLFSWWLGHLDCAVQTVKQGHNATLECHGPTNATKILLRWEKADLQSELYVFYIRDGRPNEKYQLPSFKDRVQLKDPQMKNGNFSVILKNVSMNDSGVYECHVGYDKQEPQFMSSTNLTVEEPGPTGGQSGDEVNEDGEEERGSVGLIVGLLVSSVLIGAVGGFIIYRKCRNQSDPENLENQVL